MGDTGAPHLQRFGLQTLDDLRDRYDWYQAPVPTGPAAGPYQSQRLAQVPAGCNLTGEDANVPLRDRRNACQVCAVMLRSRLPVTAPFQPVKA